MRIELKWLRSILVKVNNGDFDKCDLPVRNDIEEYKGFWILRYGTENCYRVDFGTKRSKLVATVEDARALIDLLVQF